MALCLSKPIKCETPRVSPDVNCALWVIMMCGCRFINSNKCTTKWGNVNNRGACECVWAEIIRGNFYTFNEFCCEPKPTLPTTNF